MYLLQPLSTGQLLDRIVELYRRNFLLFFSIALVAQGGEIFDLYQQTFLQSKESDGTDFLFLGISTVLSIVFAAIAEAATTVAVSDMYLNRPTSITSSFRRVFPISGRLVRLSIGYGLMIVIGTILLVIPGIYWAITYSLGTAAMTIERLGFSDSLDRSRDLVEGNRWRVVLVSLLGFVLTSSIGYALKLAIGHYQGQATAAGLVLSLEFLKNVVVSALGMPIALIGFTLIYYDARIRKEAFDIHHLIDSEAEGTVAVPTETTS